MKKQISDREKEDGDEGGSKTPQDKEIESYEKKVDERKEDAEESEM